METDLPLYYQSQHQDTQSECVTRKQFPSVIERLLCMQRHCTDIKTISTVGHFPVIRQCFQRTFEWLREYYSREKCQRCTIYHIRTVLQGAERSIIYTLDLFDRFLRKHGPYVGSWQQEQVNCEGSIDCCIGKLQAVKRQLMYVNQHCRKGEEFKQEIYSGLDELSQQNQYQSPHVYRVDRDYMQAIAVFKDPDGRPAVSRENCPTFQYTAIMRLRLKALKELYQDMEAAPAGQDKQFFLQQLAYVSAQLHKISNEPKCVTCRSFRFEEGKNRFDANVETVRAAVRRENIDSQTLGHMKSLIRVELCAFQLSWHSCPSQQYQEESQQTQESQWGMEGEEPQIEWQTPSPVYCPTRKQGTLILQRWQNLQTRYNQSMKSRLSQQQKSQLRVYVEGQLQSLKDLDEQYVTLPKCHTCSSLRSEVQRQLMQVNHKEACQHSEYVDQYNMSRQFKTYLELICLSMARVVQWCQLQPQAQ